MKKLPLIEEKQTSFLRVQLWCRFFFVSFEPHPFESSTFASCSASKIKVDHLKQAEKEVPAMKQKSQCQLYSQPLTREQQKKTRCQHPPGKALRIPAVMFFRNASARGGKIKSTFHWKLVLGWTTCCSAQGNMCGEQLRIREQNLRNLVTTSWSTRKTGPIKEA